MKRIDCTAAQIEQLLAQSSSLFAGLQPEDQRLLAAAASLRVYSAGAHLFMQDEPAKGLFVVIDGHVKVYRLSSDGREQILDIFGEGDLVGAVPVFQGGAYPAWAVAAAAAKVIYLGREELLELGQRNPKVMLRLLGIMAERLRRFVLLIDDLSLKEVSARVARYLLQLVESSAAETVTLDISKGELAAKLGTIAETLSRTLKKMQQRGAIRVDRKTIAIVDAERLRHLAAGEKVP